MVTFKYKLSHCFKKGLTDGKTVGSVIKERNAALLKLNSKFRDFGLESMLQNFFSFVTDG